MATQTEQIAASQARQRIPPEWVLEFNDWTNASLSSLAAEGGTTNRDVRAFARWELDYRLAFGIEVEDPPTGETHKYDTAYAERLVKERMANGL